MLLLLLLWVKRLLHGVRVVLRSLLLGFQNLDVLIVVETQLLLVLLALLAQTLALAVVARTAVPLARVQVVTNDGRPRAYNYAVRVVHEHLLGSGLVLLTRCGIGVGLFVLRCGTMSDSVDA